MYNFAKQFAANWKEFALIPETLLARLKNSIDFAKKPEFARLLSSYLNEDFDYTNLVTFFRNCAALSPMFIQKQLTTQIFFASHNKFDLKQKRLKMT